MTRMAGVALVALLGVGVGCTTSIRPVVKPKVEPVYVGDKSCMVQDFATATEVPDGAKNLGWVSVPYTGDDESTYVELRKKICEQGGDALSQPAWVKGLTDDKPELKANAWTLP